MSDTEKKNTALIVRPKQALAFPSAEEITTMMRVAEVVHVAGVLPAGVNTKEKAFAIALYGRELGLGPWTSWRNIYPTTSAKRPGTQMGMSADLMLGLAKARIPGFSHGQEVEYDKDGNVVAVEFWSERPGIPRLTTKHTLREAALAGLTTKDNWKQNPKQMLIAAAKRDNVRTMAADVLAGIYTPEELGGEDPAPQETPIIPAVEGEIVDITTDFTEESNTTQQEEEAPSE